MLNNGESGGESTPHDLMPPIEAGVLTQNFLIKLFALIIICLYQFDIT